MDKKKLRNRELLIITLILTAIVLYNVQYKYINYREKKRLQYQTEQNYVSTNDFNNLKQFKSPYMGDASNLINLFWSLPLRKSFKTCEQDSEKLTFQINFSDTKHGVGKKNLEGSSYASLGTADALNKIYENEVCKSLIYNSAAAFTLIDNLEHIIYHFTDVSITVSRKDIQDTYGSFDSLLETDDWNKTVREPLKDNSYVTELSKKLLKISKKILKISE